MTRQVFHNAVIGVLQIALVAKSNILYFHCVGAIAKMYKTTIITIYIIFSLDLVAGFGFADEGNMACAFPCPHYCRALSITVHICYTMRLVTETPYYIQYEKQKNE